MALAANALVSLAELKTFLGVTNTNYDTELERLINASSGIIEKLTARKLIEQTHVEFQHGRASNMILLREFPVTGGPADGATKPELRIDGLSAFGAESIVDPDDYQVNDSLELVYINGGIFPKGYKNIQVTYIAGLGTVAGGDLPADLVDGCMMLVRWKWTFNSDRRAGVQSKSKTGESITLREGIPLEIHQQIEPYMRIEFPVSNAPVMNM